MENKILKIIGNHVVENKNINLDSKIVEDLNIDSLQMMQIICEIEQNLKVKISYSHLRDIVRVRDFIKCIQGKWSMY